MDEPTAESGKTRVSWLSCLLIYSSFRSKPLDKTILGEHPEAKVVILTMYRQDRYVFEAIKAGARGYMLKDADASALIDTVRRVADGETLLNAEMAASVLDEFKKVKEELPSDPDHPGFGFPTWSRLVYAGDGLWASEEDMYNPARDAGRVIKEWRAAGGEFVSRELAHMESR